MKHKRNFQMFFHLLVVPAFLAVLSFNIAFSQDIIDVEELIQEGTTVTKKTGKGFSLFKRGRDKVTLSLQEKQAKEIEELREKQKAERIQERERKTQEIAELRQKQKEERERKKQEKAESRQKQKEERDAYKKTSEITRGNKLLARKAMNDRKKEIWEVKRLKRYVEVITNEEDPIYITKANVLDSKTEFLQVKDMEFQYKLKIKNQTPKIINSALIIWERKKPFSDSSTIMRETKISKPIVPYEERIVEYNELDSKRQGETYKVKITNVIFEDGTQWKNPVLFHHHY